MDALGVNHDAVFSHVYQSHIASLVAAAETSAINQPGVRHGKRDLPATIEGREAAIFCLGRDTQWWIERVPDAWLNDFVNRLAWFAEDLLVNYPADTSAVIDKRRGSIMALQANSWRKMLEEVGKQMISLTSQSSDTSVASGMKKQFSSWPELKETLISMTQERGGKAALARRFNVTPQAVSEWMRGISMPSADTTIRLLSWVAGGGSLQQKSPANVSASAEPKKAMPKKKTGKAKR